MFLPTRENSRIALAYWTYPRAGHAAQRKCGLTLGTWDCSSISLASELKEFPWLLSLRSEMLLAFQDGLSGWISIGKWDQEETLL